jgi:hypothetical protein
MPGNYTYVLLNNSNDVERFAAKLPAFVQHNEVQKLNKGLSYNLILQPLTSIHLQSHLQGELPGAGDISYVYLFAAIAFIILLIACINFINFATANAIKRAKEIGVRKVIGAKRQQLLRQFLTNHYLLFSCHNTRTNARSIADAVVQLYIRKVFYIHGDSSTNRAWRTDINRTCRRFDSRIVSCLVNFQLAFA